MYKRKYGIKPKDYTMFRPQIAKRQPTTSKINKIMSSNSRLFPLSQIDQIRPRSIESIKVLSSS